MLTGENVKYRKGLISGNTAISREYSGVAFAGRQYRQSMASLSSVPTDRIDAGILFSLQFSVGWRGAINLLCYVECSVCVSPRLQTLKHARS